MSYSDTEPTFWPWRPVSIQRTSGPERITEEAPPEGWAPPPRVGFAPPPVDGSSDHNDQVLNLGVTEPQLWEGDNA